MLLGEIKKLFQRRSTTILMLLLFLINGAVVWNCELPGIPSYTNIKSGHVLSLYHALPKDQEQVLGALEQQEFRLYQAIYEDKAPGKLLTEDVYSDRALFQALLTRTEPIIRYGEILKEISHNSEALLLSGRYPPQSFGFRNIIKSQQVYRQLNDIEPQIFYSGAVEIFPGGGITELIGILLSLLIALELVFSERSVGTLGLCKPTYRGNFVLIGCKILVGIFLIAIGTILLYGTNLLIGIIRCGTVPWQSPLQSVYGFIRCPWKLSIGEYLISYTGVKILWMLWVTAFAYVASYIGKNIWSCCGIFLLFVSLCFLLPNTLLNPYGRGNTVELFATYWNLNMFGYPINALAVSIGSMSLLCFLAFGTVAVLHRYRIPEIRSGRSKNRKPKTSFSVSIFTHEAIKIYGINGGIFIIAALIVIQVFVYGNFSPFIPPQERLYMHYSQSLSGKANEEKDAIIAQEEARFADLYDQLDKYINLLTRGEMKEESYTILTTGISRQLENEPVFHRARDQYIEMKNRNLDYVCLSGYDRLLGRTGQKELLRQSLFFLIAVILGMAGVFSTEHETGMIRLLNSTPTQKTVAKKKYLLGGIYGLIASVVSFAPQVIVIAKTYKLWGFSAGAESVPILGMKIGTVQTALDCYGLGLICTSVAASMVVMLLSSLCKRTVHCILISTAILIPASFFIFGVL